MHHIGCPSPRNQSFRRKSLLYDYETSTMTSGYSYGYSRLQATSNPLPQFSDSELLQDLVDPAQIISSQAQISKTFSPESSPFFLETGKLLQAGASQCFSLSPLSNAGSPSGDSFSDCSFSDSGLFSNQEPYNVESMDQSFPQTYDPFNSGSYPSPGSVTSNSVNWNYSSLYTDLQRQEAGFLAHNDSNDQICHPQVQYSDVSGSALPFSPLMPNLSGVAVASPIHGSHMGSHAQHLHNIAGVWQTYDPHQNARTLEVSAVNETKPQGSQWFDVERMGAAVTPVISGPEAKIMARSLSLDHVFSQASNHSSQLGSVTLQQSHAPTPASEHRALTPASGPLPLPVLEDWSLPDDADSDDDELKTEPDQSGVPDTIFNTTSANSRYRDGEASQTDELAMSPNHAGPAEESTIEPIRNTQPLYSVKPQDDGKYHCPYFESSKCNHLPTKLKCNYDKYIDAHIKPHRCKNPECKGLRFSSTACRLRHEREAHGSHGHGVRPYLCQYPDCDRSKPGNGFPRSWNRNDHMKRVHDHTFSGDEEIPSTVSVVKPKSPAPLNTSNKAGMKRKHPTEVASQLEDAGNKKIKRSGNDTQYGLGSSVRLQQKIDTIQGQWRQQWTEVHRYFHGVKGPLDLERARGLQRSVEAVIATCVQMNELVGNRTGLLRTD